MSTATVSTKTIQFPTLVDTREAAKILGRSVATLKRWRYEGTGPNWIEPQGRVSYDVSVLLEFIRVPQRARSNLKVRSLIGTVRLPSSVLLSGTKIVRSSQS